MMFGALMLVALVAAMVAPASADVTLTSATATGGQLTGFTVNYGEAIYSRPYGQYHFELYDASGGSGAAISLTTATVSAASADESTWTVAPSSGSFASSSNSYRVVLKNGPPAYCAEPLTRTPSSTAATTTVGTGTSASCTESAFRAAVASGGVVRFNCGSTVVVIPFVQGTPLSVTQDTTIIGDFLVEIDAQHTSRIFQMSNSNPSSLTPTLRLQSMRFNRGSATSGSSTTVSSTSSGAGGVVYHRGGTLEVIDCDFLNSRAVSPGQDVGGGAIYSFGGVLTVQGSTFEFNSGSNAGAIGTLGATPTVVNSIFSTNYATGTGGNPGNGGNGGAITMDGPSYHANYCGCSFQSNEMNALGTLFRVGYSTTNKTTIAWSEFRANVQKASGSAGGLYLQDHTVNITESAVIENRVPFSSAGGQLVSSSNAMPLTLSNVLVYGNVAESSLAAGFSLPSNTASGTMSRCTFAANSALFASAFTATDGTTGMTVANSVFTNTATNGYNPVNANHAAGPCSGSVYQWPSQRSSGQSDTSSLVCSGTAPTFQDVTVPAPSDQGCPTLSSVITSPAGVGADCPGYGTKTVGRRALYSKPANVPVIRGPIVYDVQVSGSTVTITPVTGAFSNTNSNPPSASAAAALSVWWA